MTARLPVVWHTIGGSADDPANRNVSMPIQKLLRNGGWAAFAAARIWPLAMYGFNEHVLHNPGGIRGTDGQEMQFDQWLHAKEQGHHWLTDGLAPAFRPLSAAGVTVWAYLGTPSADKQFAPQPANRGADRDDIFDRATRSIAPYLDAAIRPGLDTACYQPLRSIETSLACGSAAVGADPLLEGRPKRDGGAHWASGWTHVMGEQFYRRSDPDQWADSVWGMSRRGEWKPKRVIRLLEGTAPGAEPFSIPPSGHTWATFEQWAPALLRVILAEGDTPAIGVDQLMEGGFVRRDPAGWWQRLVGTDQPAGRT